MYVPQGSGSQLDTSEQQIEIKQTGDEHRLVEAFITRIMAFKARIKSVDTFYIYPVYTAGKLICGKSVLRK